MEYYNRTDKEHEYTDANLISWNDFLKQKKESLTQEENPPSEKYMDIKPVPWEDLVGDQTEGRETASDSATHVYTTIKTKSFGKTSPLPNSSHGAYKYNNKFSLYRREADKGPYNTQSRIENKFHYYKIKTFLNAEHYVSLNGKKGIQHPHMFEISVYVRFPGDTFIGFKDLENAFAEIIKPYQNKCLNDIEPFTSIMPTTENITEIFAEQISDMVKSIGGEVLQVATSETPSRTYVTTYNSAECPTENDTDYESEAIDRIIDARFDSLAKDMKHE